MAKQTGDITFKGTIDDLCFYEMEGGYYVRRKSSLSGKRFQQDAAFAGSRKSSSRFGEGNRLASTVYRMVPEVKRVYSLFCFLKRKSILLLKEGKRLPEAEAILRDYLVSFGLLFKETKPAAFRRVRAKTAFPLPPGYGFRGSGAVAVTRKLLSAPARIEAFAEVPLFFSLPPPHLLANAFFFQRAGSNRFPSVLFPAEKAALQKMPLF
ncbi:MAG TPA: hypothetical protein VGN63_25020 [Flavisolibacter sp.]|jgi:hypothetical protein|nr:hypothetical protein [Flavisolibacter sp.]